jgi:hypothetical protein
MQMKQKPTPLEGLPPVDPNFEFLQLAIEHGGRVARRWLRDYHPDFLDATAMKVSIAFAVSNAVVIQWLELCKEKAIVSFEPGDDYLLTLPDGKRIVIEVKGSVSDKNPPWPIAKGMGGWQRERRRKQLSEGVRVLLVQVAVKKDASVGVSVLPLSLDSVLPGKDTADYRRKFEEMSKYEDPWKCVSPP